MRQHVGCTECFDNMVRHDVVSWTTLMLGYVENGESLLALDAFTRMDCSPDRITFVAALKACASLESDKSVRLQNGTAVHKLNRSVRLQNGTAVHKLARERGLERDPLVANTLVYMYCSSGSMREAQKCFDSMAEHDVVSFNSLMLGYVENGESLMALEVFCSMDCAPNHVTFTAAVKACGALAVEKKTCLQKGMLIHRQAREAGLDKHIVVANTLVDMYGKLGSMSHACNVFESMAHHTVVSWTALILGYVENGEGFVALEVFANMDCAPNSVTYVAALKACASLGALETGQDIHDQLCELGWEQDEIVANSLVDFYAKCGDMTTAEEVFKSMRCRDIVSWTSLLGGYALLGNTCEVFTVVKRMQDAGMQMDSVTMLLILTACNHAGNVEEGEYYFESMSKYSSSATLEHYTCMVDMLGRANRLQEALSLVTSMPFEANSGMWMTLLGACGKWSNVEVGKVAFHALITLNEDMFDVTAAYVLMRNIYRRLGMQAEEELVEGARKKVNSLKTPRQTWLHGVEGRICSFALGDKIERQVNTKLKALLSIDM